MGGPAASFLALRMRSSWLLLASLLLTTFVAASCVAGLAAYDAQALPQAISRQLVRSPGMSVIVIGLVDARLAATDTRAITASVRAAFGAVPFQLDSADWSGPLALAAPGGRASAGAEVAAPGRLRAHAALAAGAWPGSPRRGQPVPAALPVSVAARLGVRPGALLTLRDPDAGTRLRLRVSGLYRQRDPADRYWGLDQVWTCDGDIQHCFTRQGPIVVSPAAFGPGGLAVDQASWVAQPDASRIGTGDLAGLAARTARAQARLQKTARLGGLVADSGMPAALAGARSDLSVARSLLVIGGLQLLLPAAGALVLIAGLLASRRDEEHVLLGARGAGRWQLGRPALAEALAVGAAGAAAGALAGPRLAGLLARTGLLRGAGLHLSGIPAQAWYAVLAVLLLCVVIMVWPALRPSAPGGARARRGRPPALAAAVRAGGDLALLALGAAAVWELRAYSAGARPLPGGTGVDPVLAAAPALALAGLAVIPLRALPVAARVLDRLAGAGRHLSAALASWEISRRPVRQAVPALLAVLAVATGTLALAQYQSGRQSALDQAAFSAGADLRVDTPDPVAVGAAATVARAPGVTAATPVSAESTGSGGDVLALDARAASATVLLRPDLSPVPAAALWRRITPRSPAAGLGLPGRPARLEITAALASGLAPGELGRASVTASVQDAYGAVYAVPAGVLPADGRDHGLTAMLSPARQAAYPLRLLGLSLSYLMPPAAPRPDQPVPPARLAIAGLAVAAAATGPLAPPFAGGAALAAWRPAAVSPNLTTLAAPATAAVPTASGAEPGVAAWRPGPGRGQVLTFRPGRGPAPAGAKPDDAVATITLTAPLPAAAIAGIATRAFLRDSSVRVGATVPVAIGPAMIPVHIVAAIASFPTVAGGGALVVDLAAAQDALARRLGQPLPVTAWWLRSATGAVPAGLPAGTIITSRARRAAGLLSDPVAAAPQQAALAVAGAAALLAAIGFSVSIAAGLRSRRAQHAVLAALGVSRSAQARQLCLEELMLALPAAGAGLLAGAGLAHLLIPAVTITAAAAAPVPPVAVQVPLGWAAALAVVVAVIPVLAAAVTVARRPDPAAQLRAVEAA